ncbi:hypothetical protein FBY33_1411 [Arthrobacter sp. SLBN-112]|jgi:hypothetical protein|nr:hypothetical protein FBY33_1411 [Arthrobacter sp. SLBN-112]
MLNPIEVLNHVKVPTRPQFPSGTISAAQRLRGGAA